MLNADKTRMIELPYGEKIMTIMPFSYRNVTDGQTDRQTELLYQYRVKNQPTFACSYHNELILVFVLKQHLRQCMASS